MPIFGISKAPNLGWGIDLLRGQAANFRGDGGFKQLRLNPSEKSLGCLLRVMGQQIDLLVQKQDHANGIGINPRDNSLRQRLVANGGG